MSEGGDRRARKKAATRALVLQTAQRLFEERGFDAVTIADIAGTADVAVQTVFNHFSTKEELFFADRDAWVAASAAAVRGRAAAEAPEEALRRSLLATLEDYLGRLGEPSHRSMVATVAATPALQVHERELTEKSRRLLQEALVEAWAEVVERRKPDALRRAAALVAATWTTSVRTVADEYREPMPPPEEAPALAQEAVALLDRVLRGLESTLRTCETLHGRD
ncbi:TetR/AcrR family transcriptional regulator [Blastococcus sp. TF02A-26]|uniref:TetR/AcrR family transcriptional regulator n=1 Tax=Blastococcus sp. TF02A-26 TaxID=2250577 RepID=UPI000DEC014B|nr:TetR/AcrR family transcriptional regulator [Blastococcus sp. TF02A-26]